VRALQARTAENVNANLTAERLWSSGGVDDPDFPIAAKTYPERLSEAIRYAAGRLGPILEQYGYIPSDPQATGSWFDSNQPERWRDSHRFYSGELEWSEEMTKALNDYNGVVMENYGFLQAIEELEEQRDETKAAELWNAAP
jgi:hypothetical protein